MIGLIFLRENSLHWLTAVIFTFQFVETRGYLLWKADNFVRITVGLRIAPNGGQILAQALTWQTIGCSPRKFLNPDSTQCFMYSLHFTYCCNDVTLNNIYPYCNSWTSIVCLSLLAQLADQGCHFWRKSPIRRHFWRNSDRKASLFAAGRTPRNRQ